MPQRRLFEGLEPRQLLAAFTVTNTNDSGAGSLRQALLDANAVADADTIAFAAALDGQTITLTTAELTISNPVSINSAGAIRLTISGNNAMRVFNVTSGTSSLNGLTITGGNSGVGGGIANDGVLTITNCTISGNSGGAGVGGGIYNGGTLAVRNSTISGNSANSGGGIYIDFGALTITNSTVSANTATTGGGISRTGGTMTAISTIVAGNTGSDVSGNFAGGSTNNLIQNAASAGGLTNGVNGNLVGVNPLLGALAENGGPTRTYALQTGSPAIGAGINPASLTTDQRGGPFARGTAVDIGAYQRQTLALVVDTLVDENDGNYIAGDLSLREAIAAAGPNPGNDTITFAPALNGGTITLGGTELTVSGDLTITGPGANLLTVSGNNASRVFSFSSGTSALSGITITGGSINSGGGIVNNATLTITNATISGNNASAAGGIRNLSTMTITNSTVSGNSGGGIGNEGTLTITNCTISGNSSSSDGGGIVNSGSLAVVDSTISGNTAGNGGGIYSYDTLTVTNSIISGNSATGDGGGIGNDSGTLLVTNSTISGNSAILGGGMYGYGAVTITNSTFSGNTANIGGGIYNFETLTITNSTVASNLGGAGVSIHADGTLTARSTIVAGNTGGDVSGSFAAGSTNNLIQNAASAGGLTNSVNGNLVGVDPKLGTLASNGGPTQTMALAADSPAIGKGLNPNNLTTDQRGGLFVRGTAVDIGAYQRQTLALVVDTLVDENDGNYTPGDLSLREAIAFAGPNPGNDTITFASALNGGTITLGGTELTVTGDVSITGPGAGPGAGVLTVSGNTLSRVFNFASGTSTLSGLKITGGSAGFGGGIYNAGTLTVTNSNISGNTANNGGGGIDNSNGTLTVTNSTISGNTANNGGGIRNVDGTATITNSTISGNTASYGGGIDNRGPLTVTNSTISGNTAIGGGGIYNSNGTLTITDSTISGGSGYGGGISSHQSTITITNSTISGNTSPTDAGGIYSFKSTLTITGSTFSQNSTGAAGWGGGIYLEGGTLSLTNSTISENGAGSEGGGVYIEENGTTAATITSTTISQNTVSGSGSGGGIRISGGTVTITNSTVLGNTGSNGGGIHNAGTLTITNSTISGNTANYGGGVFTYAGLTITNSTFSGNTANSEGGGVYVYINTTTISNSTISGNTAGVGGGISNYGTLTAKSTIVAGNTGGDVSGTFAGGSTNNLIQNAGSAGGLTNGVNGNIVGVDPLLGPLADNGGPTRTHALLAGSPAINKGINPNNLTTDQRGTGFARSRGTGIDIGAFEFSAIPTITSLTSSASSVARGQSVTLTANTVADSDGTITRVDFYRDANGNGVADAGELIGNDSSSAGGYTFVFNSAGAPAGANSFLAVAVDNDGGPSTPRAASVTIVNAAPALGTLTPSTTSLAQGDSLTLTAGGATDTDGTVASVRFYRDANGNGTAEPGELLGTDSDSAGGYTCTLTTDQSNALPLGSVAFLAVTIDSDGATSNTVQTTASVVFSTRAGAARAASGSADSANTHRAVSVNPNGHVIVFQAGWTVADLQALTGAPNAVSDAAIWVDPKDDLTYVAAPSNDGLILFTRAADGAWSFRNLSTETSATASPTNRLVHFISKDRIVVVAGFDANGNIVAFRQTLATASGGGPEFSFVDISGQLTGQAMATPAYSSMTTFVTNWNTWHLVGIDTGGQIQSVWIDVASFSLWRVDNLSAQYGAAPVQGQLAVTLTSWGGINLTGLDTSGHLRVTWWVPGSIWENADLTSAANGASFTGGSITGYGTPWGGMNYIGLDSDGQVVGYWWAPDNDRWFSGRFLPENVPSTSLPARTLTSYSSDAGTLNIFGVASDDDAVRMWWQPGAEAWTVENLTEVAVRA